MIARPHVLPNQPQCGLRILEPVKPSLYPRGPGRVKRTHIANQMKRVQEDESPWRSLGRGRSAASTFCPSVLPAENTAKSICLRKNALCLAADSVPRVPSFSVGIAIKERASPK